MDWNIPSFGWRFLFFIGSLWLLQHHRSTVVLVAQALAGPPFLLSAFQISALPMAAFPISALPGAAFPISAFQRPPFNAQPPQAPVNLHLYFYVSA